MTSRHSIYTYTAFLLFLPSLVLAQFSAAEIPPDLKKGVGVVIRQHDTHIRIINEETTEINRQVTLTLLDKKAQDEGIQFIPYDDLLSKVSNISGFVFDKTGRQVSKLRKKDIIDGAIPTSSLAESGRFIALQFDVPSYPATITYSYTKTIPSLFYFRFWSPLRRNSRSLALASLTIESPRDIPVQYRWQSAEEIEPVTKHDDKKWVYQWSLSNLKLAQAEVLGLRGEELIPRLYLTQDKLKIGSIKGSMASWKSFGALMYELQQGRQELPEALARKVGEIAKQSDGAHETIANLYRFMQENIRYESIQLGIGGFQAFTTDYVYEKGYGDCKALSNYMGSMLQYVGIPSYYTLVGAGSTKPPIMTDFAYSPFNHVILCAVPAAGDTVWLECTSPSSPSGYLGSFTADRNVLLCTPEGGILRRTPSAPPAENLYQNDLEVWLAKDGSARIEGELFRRGEADRLDGYHALPNRELRDWLKELLSELGTVQIEELEALPDSNESIPGTRIRFKTSVSRFANVSGTRMFLKPNVVASGSFVLPEKNRTQPIINYLSTTRQNRFVYHLPEGYTIEAMDADLVQAAEVFGKFTYQTKLIDSQTLEHVSVLEYQRCRLPASYYETLRKFMTKLGQTYRRQVVLNNKS